MQRLAGALPQRRVCHQPMWTDGFTFPPEQEATWRATCAEVFAETGMAFFLAPCRPAETAAADMTYDFGVIDRGVKLFYAAYCCRC